MTPESFTATGRDWLERAFKAYAAEDTSVVPMFFAFALESLAKAFLCSVNPALLVELRGDLDSLLHHTGQGKHAKRKSPRTVGASEALIRARRLLPELAGVPIEPLNDLIEMRNGTVHGVLSNDEAVEKYGAVVSACGVLLDAIGVSEAERWGEWSDVASSFVAGRANQVQARARARVAQARVAFDLFMTSLPDEPTRQMVIAAKAASFDPRNLDRVVEVDCPSCENTAMLYGWDDIRWEIDWDVEGSTGPAYPAGEYPVVTMHPTALACPVCGLALEDDELSEYDLGYPQEVELEDEEIAELHEEQRADYEEYRR